MKTISVKMMLVVTAIGGGLLVAANVSAKSVNLDEPTVRRGYTVDYDDMQIGILPDVFSEPTRVKVEKFETILSDAVNADIISDKFIYDIKMTRPRVLAKPITLKIPFQSDTLANKQIYIWHRERAKWIAIPTDVNEEQKYARAFVHFPFSIVAVFEGEGEEIVRRNESQFPGLSASSALVVDAKTGIILYQKNAGTPRSIASLTKMMTAYVFLQNNPGWEKEVMITAADNVGGAAMDWRPGEVVTVRDLFYATLVGSRNNAAKALVRATGLGEAKFVAQMNERAADWGLTQTRFVEPTGLSAANVGSARDYVRLSNRVLQRPEIMQATSLPAYNVTTRNTGRVLGVRNTNRLTETGRYYLTGGKTGFTYEAGYCLMTRLRPERDSRNEIITLVMGDTGYANLFTNTEALANWVYGTFVWQN
jgi:serine-type D-Ala-D-Ala endopeptidase (penicillin-binding protein 7)